MVKTRWDYSELPECVENLSAWLDENDGTMTWDNARDLSLILDWFKETGTPIEMHKFGRIMNR